MPVNGTPPWSHGGVAVAVFELAGCSVDGG